jgi:predicted TIM-barrel fold metal-dependent hydrolase
MNQLTMNQQRADRAAAQHIRDEAVAAQVLRLGRPTSVTFIEEPLPEALFCPIISADDHVLEPADLFERRLPRRFLDRAPRVETDEQGFEWWLVDRTRLPNLMVNGASGRAMPEWDNMASARYDECRKGTWDPRARLADMDLCGIWASLCFPSALFGFAGTRFARIADPELGLACVRAYNDWMLEEWCGAAPERYIACQIPWLADAETAAGEIRRNAARGFTSVTFSENPEGLGFPDIYGDYWDPFFRACEETGTVVNLHVGSSGNTRQPSTKSPMQVKVALFPESGIETLIDWLFARIPLRFPDLRVVLSEAGASWVPMAVERIRRAHRVVGTGLNDWPLNAPSPLELVRRMFWFTSIEDPAAFRLLDIIGEDRVMVETDYPHYDSTWPQSQQMIRSELTGLEPATIRRVCFETAAALYRHPLPPAAMLDRAEVR